MKANFNDIYEKIYKSSKKELNRLKLETLAKIVVCLGLCIYVAKLSFHHFNPDLQFWIFVVLPFLGTIGAVFSFFQVVSFKKIYKKKVIELLIKGYNNSFKYYPDDGITSFEYSKSKFDEMFNKLYTEDLIVGKLEKGNEIKMSEVRASRRTKESDSTTFYGIYGFVKLDKIIPNSIIIKNNSIIEGNNYNKIELESSEFEKKFNLYATNKIHALKIFTTDLIDKITFLNKEIRSPYEIKIENSMIYFRCIYIGAFEAPFFKDGISFDLLYKYFAMINYPIQVIEEIIKNIDYIEK